MENTDQTVDEKLSSVPGTTPTARGSEELLGHVLHDRYRLEEHVASGAMGAVYRATHLKLGSEFAVKVIHGATDARGAERFAREATLASSLSHPNTVRVTDFSREGPHPYLVMEYLRGRTLAQLIAEHGALPPVWVEPVMRSLLSALDAAHGAGIVHRDVKPSNCMLVDFAGFGETPQLKLLDFGLAKPLPPDGAGVTASGAIAGTANYMSPEQVRAASVDHRSDLYSVAALAFEALTGFPPFQGKSAVDVLWQHLHQPAPSLRDINPEVDVPPRLARATVRGLQKDPTHRFGDAREFLAALDSHDTGDLEHPAGSKAPRRPEFEVKPTDGSGQPVALATPEGREWFALRGLLDRVQRGWIAGVLDRSWIGTTPVPQRRSWDVDLVETPWEGRRVAPLPSDDPAVSVGLDEAFERSDRHLLIVGEAGFGKTLSLLRIVRSLGDRIDQQLEFSDPIPVVFTLSTWRPGEPLVDWLESELATRYYVSRRVAHFWLTTGRILPCLDGLDETRLDSTEACVQAINEFRKQHAPPGLIVTSRPDAIGAVRSRLNLGGALVLHELDDGAVQRQLAGSELEPLRAAMAGDPGLAEVGRIPLLLQLMSSTCRSSPQFRNELGKGETALGHVYESYIDNVLRRGDALEGGGLRLNLRRLAQGMGRSGQTMFFLERLQPSWLRSVWARGAYGLGTRALVAMLFSMSIVPAVAFSPLQNAGFTTSMTFAIRLALIATLVLGLGHGLTACLRLSGFRTTKPGAPRQERIGPRSIGYGLLTCLSAGLAVGLLTGFGEHQAAGVMGVETGVLGCFLLGPARRHRKLPDDDISTIERLRWVPRLALGPSIVLVAATLVVLVVLWGFDALSTAAYVATCVLAVGMMALGVVTATETRRLALNQGIHTTTLTMLSLAGPAFVLTSLAFGAGYGPSYGACVGLTLAVVVGLWFGGTDLIHHYFLRALLWCEAQLAPLPALALERAVELGLMRKVGNGYMFLHRTMQHHFAGATVDDD